MSHKQIKMFQEVASIEEARDRKTGQGKLVQKKPKIDPYFDAAFTKLTDQLSHQVRIGQEQNEI